MTREPLAIVGMACRFPGSSDSAEAFWKTLRDGVDAIRDVPGDRWDIRKFYDPDHDSPGRGYVTQGGFLNESIWDFDSSFFGISAREVSVMDPQQRLLLEVTWEAFENAGLPMTDAMRKRTGVYVGAFCFDNAVQQMSQPSRDAISSHSATSSSMVMLSNRLSYVFDLQGPSFTVDTACSSSLVATHLACRALWDGECDVAVIGGVNVMLRPEMTVLECKGGFLAPDARCRTFDAAASGYVRAEGAGVVVVRPLSSALAAGDHIIALIRGTGVNQDGRTSGITVPNGDAQEALINEVCRNADVDPALIDYVEAHGTGTPVGDPIEANALGRAIGQRKGAGNPTWVGSLKSNMGHLEAAAGVAGLMKAALCLARQELPPNLHLVNPNPKIDFDGLGLRVPTQVERLAPEQARFAAINSFGYGGTNAHVIIERAPQAHSLQPTDSRVGPWVFPLSARADGALEQYAHAVAQQVRQNNASTLTEFGHALAVRRAHHDHRAVVIASSREELLGRLDQLASKGRDPGLRTGRATGQRRLVWVYTGMGAQWWGMGRSLFETVPEFRDAILACDAAWQRAGGEKLSSIFDSSQQMAQPFGAPVPEPRDAQPANLALQVGLTMTLRSLGIEADAIVGHSVGEIGAAWAAGALTLDDAFRLTFHRSRLQQEQLGQGTMLAVSMSAAMAREKILTLAPEVDIAAFNDDESVTLGGTEADLQRIAAWAQDNGIKAQLLKVGVAYHSRQMEPLRERFHAALDGLASTAPVLPLYSTVTGAAVRAGEHDVDYWWRNAREPVLLADALDQLRADGYDAFLEIGPHVVLGPSILRKVPGAATWASQRRGSDEFTTLLSAVGDAYCAGVNVDWNKIYPFGDIELRAPRYPFQRQPVWRETAASRADRLVEELHPLLHERLPTPLPAWQTILNERFLPWLPDHRVAGSLIFPGAGYAIAALAVAESLNRGNAVEDLVFQRALEPRSQTLLQLSFDPRDGNLLAHSQAPGEAGQWHIHATARIPEGRIAASTAIDIATLRQRCNSEVDVALLYQTLASQGLQYGPSFRCIRALSVGIDEALATLECDEANAERYLLHPALLDAAFQSMLGISLGSGQKATYVPVQIASIRVHARATASVFAHVRVSRRTATGICGDLCIFDADGNLLAEVEGIRCHRVGADNATDDISANLYAWHWEQAPQLESAVHQPAHWLIVDEGTEQARTIAAEARRQGLDVDIVQGSDLAMRIAHAEQLSGILDFRPSHLDPASDPTGENACADLLYLVQLLVREGRSSVRLAVATRCAMPTGDMRRIDPAASAVWGLARVVMSEQPALGVKLIDLGDDAVDPAQFLDDLLMVVAENEVALRGTQRYVPRLDHWQTPPQVPVERSLDEPMRLELGTPGVLDSLKWVPDRRRAPGPNEIEIRVHNTSLNFKDVMKALNMLSSAYLESTFIGDYLGMECSGTVVAVGKDVTEYVPGDEVIAIDTNGCFRSYHTVRTGYVFHKPAALSFAAAPALIAYVTPYYGFKYLAQLQPGETVLIHSASGGVGLAAIEIARWLGATVIATAGSPAKRELLRARGVEHVFDSRSLEFADQVMQITSNRGVDVVLNSLAGEAARKSVAILAPHGRFIEIGKKDIAAGGMLSLADFDRNLMYVAVDTDRMGIERPKLFRQINAEVIELIAEGKLSPIPTQEMQASEITEAFRMMARSQHVGKLVLNLRSGTVPTLSERKLTIQPQQTWVVTGGLGGFGLQVARWLVEQGARELLLVGRSGANRPEAAEAVAHMQATGANVVVEAVDVTDGAAVHALVERITDTGTRIQGIVHGAMVLDDGNIDTLDETRLAAVMRPKALGAWNLHEATKALPIEAFVMFSSVATIIGNAGQGSYVAANSYLDALAWQRRTLGLPALTINWGPISDTGVVARNQGTAAYLENLGILGLSSTVCIQALEYLLAVDAAQVGVVRMDWPRWAASAGPVVRSPRFRKLVNTEGKSAGDEPKIAAELRPLSAEERKAVIQERIRDRLARVMHQDISRVDVSLSLDNMGVDSLMAVELISSLRAELGIELSAMTLMMHGTSVIKLAEQVLATLFPEEAPTPDANPAAPPIGDVDELSEEELDAILALS